ncbi:cell division inhibitor MinD [Halorubrum saccharovorum]|uniref:Cell division inhibitor MinD n=1 Tax=Halorubrum saccharovorum TaxID=2248 RepID=A0A081EY02_9EURY|nr:P-loop NTPase [Halorubrum saccharovorum]KDS92290.1 cell division inhibitor MinD [Halorubrum saccharovorum]
MIAVAGGKGGSGKTTTTLGLARALSRRGAPVVAADADWDLPNLARLSSATNDERNPAADAPTAIDAVQTEGEIRPDRRAPTVLAAPHEPEDADAEQVLGALTEAVPDDTPILLDCPAGASPDAAAPLRVAEQCLLVTPLRRAALRDTAKTAALARQLNCHPVGTVAVRAESVPEGVGDLLGCPVLGRVPPAEPEPLSDSSVRSAYDALARRLVAAHGRDRWRVA